MAQAEINQTLNVEIERMFQVVTRYEDYPQFVEGCESVQVERKTAGQARVTYKVNMMKEVNYTLDHREDPAKGLIEWTLVESDTFKKNTGRWKLTAAGPGKTEIHYELEVDFKIPVPGFILNRLVKGSLPAMLESFEKQAQKSTQKGTQNRKG